MVKENGFSYTIIRLGQLFRGSYDIIYNLEILFQLDKDAEVQHMMFGKGNEPLVDTMRNTLVEVTAQICMDDYAKEN